MARIRTIKPELWTDSKFVSLEPFARLLFMGMWNFADDCGHIEDEPLRLKLSVLPADKVDADALVQSLVDIGLVQRLPGCLYIAGFEKHQRVDKRATCRFDESQLFPTNPADSPRRKGREWNVREEEDAMFLSFWEQYPKRNGKKIGKAKTASSWKRLSKEQRERALIAVGHYADACNQGLTLAKDPERFLKADFFEDWMTPAQPRSDNGKAESVPEYVNVTGT